MIPLGTYLANFTPKTTQLLIDAPLTHNLLLTPEKLILNSIDRGDSRISYH